MKRLVSAALAVAIGVSSATAFADTFASGSLIIPMDTTYQDSGMLKAYGLVYELLRNGVPVRWVIQPGKTFGQADFTASAKNIKTNAAITSYGYRGGPFVIDSADAAAALPIVNAWIASNTAVVVHQATAPFTGNVARRLVVAPRVAMHADGNQKIAISYLTAAGIPDSNLDYTWPATSPDLLTPAEVAGPTTTNHRDGALFDADGDPVYCQFMSMHYNVTDAQANPEVVAEVRAFLTSPVHFFAECQAVNAFENLVPYGHFLTPNGYLIKSQPSSVDYYHADQTFMQIDGSFATVGGSEPAYALPAGDHYKAGDITMLTAHGSAPETYDVWMTGYLDGACPPNAEVCGSYGKVSYLGGHQYDVKLPISNNPKTQGVRLFLNSLFDSTCAAAEGLPNIYFTKAAPATTTSATVTFSLNYANGGPSVALAAVLTDPLPAGATFVSATSGGTFANGKVTWNLGNLGVGEGGTVSVTVTLGGLGTYQNTGSLAYKVGLNGFTKASNTTSTLYDKDSDGDGVLDAVDICPNAFNPQQDLSSDVNSCGKCGTVCTVGNGDPWCIAGTCAIGGCNPGFADCDGSYANGCEHDTSTFATDPNNCGGCGVACSFANAAALCTGGACALGTCQAGFSNCNGVAADGCEYANAGFATDPNNCGGCGKKCAAGFVCSGGTCVVSNCPAGFSDCNGSSADGCEYANSGFQTDVNNCGGCKLGCAPAHATGACTAGACTIGQCAAGFHDCNGLASDGCEVPDATFQTDPNHCGGCGIVCAPAHAAGSCVMGACGIASCAAGFHDCNGTAADGCEVSDADFLTDANNCGGCGIVCTLPNATAACTGGMCTIAMCAPGTVDLDGNPANGCEYACTKKAMNDVTCDGVDDDCDGQIDEDYAPTSCGQGACAAMSTCKLGVESCTPGAPAVEGPAGSATCSNGVDDDCDGLVDGADGDCTMAGCQSDADCDDGNACTLDACSGGFCTHSGLDCDAGSMGTGGAGSSSSTSSGGGGGGSASTSSSSSSGATSSSSGAGGSVNTSSSSSSSGATSSSSGATSSSSGSASGSTSSGSSGGEAGDQGSCACTTAPASDPARPLGVFLAAAALAMARRRRSAR